MAVVALIGWIPFSALLFAFLRPVRAVTLAYLGGQLLLPVGSISIEGFWDIEKITVTNLGVVLGGALFRRRLFSDFKVNFADIMLVILACGGFVTSLANGLGVRDGVSSLGHNVLYFAVPFWYGRAVLRERRDMTDAARLIVYGAAVYAIIALWEWRMSPQIHRILYGEFQHVFAQHYRWGFYRPIVCFPHALGLGMFMAWTSLLGIAMHRARMLRSVLGIPSAVIIAMPVAALLGSMSLGPWGLFLVGLCLLGCWRRKGWRWLLWLPAALAVSWMVCRFTGVTDGRWLTAAVAKVSEERAGSVSYRIDAESLQIDHSKQRMILGWGKWNRGRAQRESGNALVVMDGRWIIMVSSFGLVGLVSFYLWWCWPLVMSAFASEKLEQDPVLMAVLVSVALQAVNLLFNAFLTPVLTFMCGGAVVLLTKARPEVPASCSRFIT